MSTVYAPVEHAPSGGRELLPPRTTGGGLPGPGVAPVGRVCERRTVKGSGLSRWRCDARGVDSEAHARGFGLIHLPEYCCVLRSYLWCSVRASRYSTEGAAVKGWRWLSSNLHALERRTHCSLLVGGRSLAGCVCTVQESLYHRVHSQQQQGGRAARGGGTMVARCSSVASPSRCRVSHPCTCHCKSSHP